MDLLDENWAELGTLDGTTDTVTDGRFVFASNADSGTVTVIDSGMWTRDHEDHFHYYRGSPRIIGSIDGSGPATISPGASATGIHFADSGESILLDSAALGEGELSERFRLEGAPQAGSLVQLGSVALRAGDSGVQALTADGVEMTDAVAPCAGAGPPITTPVGVAYPCADDVLLATDDDGIQFERIAYPDAAAATPLSGTVSPAVSFATREGRPTVAGLAGNGGVWLLDTRERTLTLLPTEAPLLQVIAVDDDNGHVLGLTRDGRVTVLTAAGSIVATTGPLLPQTIQDADLLASVEIVADQQRAYLNAPAEKLLVEIDFADSARIARSFPTIGVPRFLAGTGR